MGETGQLRKGGKAKGGRTRRESLSSDPGTGRDLRGGDEGDEKGPPPSRPLTDAV